MPLDARLFSPTLGSAFGLPGFCTTNPHAAVHAPFQPGQQQQPAHPQQPAKPVARWGGAAKDELVRRQQPEQQQLPQDASGFQQQSAVPNAFHPPQEGSAPSAIPGVAAAQQQRNALQAFQHWAAAEPSAGMQASGHGGAGMSVGSSGQHPLQLQQQRSSFESGMAAAFQHQRSSLEAQHRPSFESVVAAAQNRPSFESVVAAAQHRSSFEEGVAAAMQQQQRTSIDQQQQQRASFETNIAGSQLYHAQQYMAAQANLQEQQRQQQQFNAYAFPMQGAWLLCRENRVL